MRWWGRVPPWLWAALIGAHWAGWQVGGLAMGDSPVPGSPPPSACELVRPEALARLGLTVDGPVERRTRDDVSASECLWSAGPAVSLDVVVNHHGGDGRPGSARRSAGWPQRVFHSGLAEVSHPAVPGAEAVQVLYGPAAMKEIDGREGITQVQLWMQAGAYSVLVYWTTTADERGQAEQTARWLAAEVVAGL
ncbi:hypothetical protein [Catellatospora sp. NPDC049609]|uniref:hypothetical protein n=1 Tax=Catellatospora sp. NPDC049609 TaxID=3155505 RepID=UPI003433AE97